jgi:phage terminase large subunit GpA-like protein
MSPALKKLEADLASMWEPKERPDPLTWAEREIVIDPRFSPRPGRFSCDFTPYLRQLHLWFGDRSVRQITFVKSAQIGGTTLLANLIQYAIAEDPGPILYVTSTAENAKSWSERELIPRLRSCAAIKKVMPDDPDLFKKTEMQFKSCTVKLVGSNSEANLASRPTRYLFCDEVDKWPDASATEAPSLELAMARTNFYRSICKRVLVSTPTVATGAIYSQFMAGSQHRYHVACPECGHLQHLQFENVRWSDSLRGADGAWDLDGVADSACYQCEECGDLWPQETQRALVAGGRWIIGNPAAPRDHLSCHLNAMYSPQSTWGELAKLFLQKKGTPGGLHDFHNTYLGMPWEDRATTIKDESLMDLRGAYRQREIPEASVIDGQQPMLTLCADPGGKRTHWTVEARIMSGESWVIDWGEVEDVDDLVREDFLNARAYLMPDGETIVRPMAGLIDSGFFTERVYAVCARSSGLFYPSKGGAATFTHFSASPLPGLGTMLYAYSDFVWKMHLYVERIQKKLPPLLHFPADASREFLSGHSGQVLVENRNNRVTPFQFKNVENDHYGDCTKLHCVTWAILKEKL